MNRIIGGGEVEKSGHQSFNGISDLSLEEGCGIIDEEFSKRSVVAWTVLFRILFYLVYCAERMILETNEEQRKITRRRRKRKSKERIERGNIDEIRYFFLSFLERIFEAPSFVRKRLVVTDRVWAFSDDNRCVLHKYATNYR